MEEKKYLSVSKQVCQNPLFVCLHHYFADRVGSRRGYNRIQTVTSFVPLFEGHVDHRTVEEVLKVISM
jgi:hypothetical protein